jgi:hypothetical protein
MCDLLCKQEGCDELSITMLKVMLIESKIILPPEHPDLFDIQLSMIQFHGHDKKFLKAAELGESLIESSEILFGKTI